MAMDRGAAEQQLAPSQPSPGPSTNYFDAGALLGHLPFSSVTSAAAANPFSHLSHLPTAFSMLGRPPLFPTLSPALALGSLDAFNTGLQTPFTAGLNSTTGGADWWRLASEHARRMAAAGSTGTAAAAAAATGSSAATGDYFTGSLGLSIMSPPTSSSSYSNNTSAVTDLFGFNTLLQQSAHVATPQSLFLPSSSPSSSSPVSSSALAVNQLSLSNKSSSSPPVHPPSAVSMTTATTTVMTTTKSSSVTKATGNKDKSSNSKRGRKPNVAAATANSGIPTPVIMTIPKIPTSSSSPDSKNTVQYSSSKCGGAVVEQGSESDSDISSGSLSMDTPSELSSEEDEKDNENDNDNVEEKKKEQRDRKKNKRRDENSTSSDQAAISSQTSPLDLTKKESGSYIDVSDGLFDPTWCLTPGFHSVLTPQPKKRGRKPKTWVLQQQMLEAQMKEQKRQQEELKIHLEAQIKQQQLQLKLARKAETDALKKQQKLKQQQQKTSVSQVTATVSKTGKTSNKDKSKQDEERSGNSESDSGDSSSESGESSSDRSMSETRTEKQPKRKKRVNKKDDNQHSDAEVKPKRRKLLDETELRIPLEYGWRRETRIKSVSSRGGLLGEVIYHTPCSRKLRTYPDVTRYLEKNNITDLTLDNFTFRPRVNVGDFLELRENQGYVFLSETEVTERFMLSRNQAALTALKTDKSSSKKRKLVGLREGCSYSETKLKRKLEQQEIAKKAAEIKAKKRLEKLQKYESLKKAKQMRALERKKQREEMKNHKEQERQQRLEQIRIEREMRAQQLLEQQIREQERRQRKQESQRMKFIEMIEKAKEREVKRHQAVIMKEQERERRRQHMMLVKALEARKKQEERERMKEERKEEKRINRQKKWEQRQAELQMALELKKPIEDMEIADHRPMPTFQRLKSVKLAAKAFSDCLMIIEFLNNFGEALGFSKYFTSIPTLNSLQLALINDPEHEDELMSLTTHLLKSALQDPGVPNPREATTLLHQRIADVEIIDENISEILRIFIKARSNNEETKHVKLLKERPLQALNPTHKAEILAFLCNELLCSKNIVNEIDRNIDSMNNYRRDKWVVDGTLRKLKTIQAKKTNRPDKSVNESLNDSTMDDVRGDEEDESGNDSDGAVSEIGAHVNVSEVEENLSLEDLEKKIEKLNKQQATLREQVFTSSHKLRGMQFGQDRYHRRYWVLPHIGALYIESMESSELPSTHEFSETLNSNDDESSTVVVPEPSDDKIGSSAKSEPGSIRKPDIKKEFLKKESTIPPVKTESESDTLMKSDSIKEESKSESVSLNSDGIKREILETDEIPVKINTKIEQSQSSSREISSDENHQRGDTAESTEIKTESIKRENDSVSTDVMKIDVKRESYSLLTGNRYVNSSEIKYNKPDSVVDATVTVTTVQNGDITAETKIPAVENNRLNDDSLNDKTLDRKTLDEKNDKTINKTTNKTPDKILDETNDKLDRKTLDETNDKTLDETNDKTTDKTLDETNDKTDKTLDETNDKTDKTLDETNDKTLDETNDETLDKTTDKTNDGAKKTSSIIFDNCSSVVNGKVFNDQKSSDYNLFLKKPTSAKLCELIEIAKQDGTMKTSSSGQPSKNCEEKTSNSPSKQNGDSPTTRDHHTSAFNEKKDSDLTNGAITPNPKLPASSTHPGFMSIDSILSKKHPTSANPSSSSPQIFNNNNFSGLNAFNSLPVTVATSLSAEQMLKNLSDRQKSWFSVLPKMPCDESSLTRVTTAVTTPTITPHIGGSTSSPFFLPVPFSPFQLQSPMFASFQMGQLHYSAAAAAAASNYGLMGYPGSATVAPPCILNGNDSSLITSTAASPSFYGPELTSSPATCSTPVTEHNVSLTPVNQIDTVRLPKPEPIPEEMKRGWWKTSSVDDVRLLTRCLHPRGIRERMLQKQLQKYSDYILHSCEKAKQEGVEDNDENTKNAEEEIVIPEADDEDSYIHRALIEVNMTLMDDVETLAERVMGASLQIKGWKMPPKPDYSDEDQEDGDDEDVDNKEEKPTSSEEKKTDAEKSSADKEENTENEIEEDKNDKNEEVTGDEDAKTDEEDVKKEENEKKSDLDSHLDDLIAEVVESGKTEKPDQNPSTVVVKETTAGKKGRRAKRRRESKRSRESKESVKSPASNDDGIAVVKKKQRSPEEMLNVARERLLALERNIERRYLKPPLNRNVTLNLPTVLGSRDNSGGDHEEDAPPGLINWRNASRKCVTAAQLQLCLIQLNCAIAWEKSIMKVICQICVKDDNEAELLLCDGCDKGYHTYCFKPRMDAIPDGEWYCYECLTQVTGAPHCVVCGKKNGRMAQCDDCPRAFHIDCLTPPLPRIPRKWQCASCALLKIKPRRRRSSKILKEIKLEKKPDEDNDIPEKRAKREVLKTELSDDMTPCKSVLSDLEAHDQAWPFRAPVNTKQFPQYKRFIKHPMDLRTISNKLRDNSYTSRAEFAADVRLVFDNCEKFNEDESEVGQAGHALRKLFEKRWLELLNSSTEAPSSSNSST